VREFDAHLDRWLLDPAIGVIVIRGAGERAFCAGGDIRTLYDHGRGGSDYTRDFFREEYRLNRRIKRYPKPYVAFIDGITMGGGVGLSVHGAFRVATEGTRFAMPETGIGFFPDVGGSYFLSRCPGRIGLYMALTGARLGPADCVHAGLATHYIPYEREAAVIGALGGLSNPAVDDVAAVLDGFNEDPGPAPIAEHRGRIDDCFRLGSVTEILAALDAAGDDWSAETAATIRQKSPSSLEIAYRQVRAGADLDFEGCMIMEYRLSQRFMDSHDFFEGVRAVIVDKDNAPDWQPATLDAVDPAAVDAYFAPLGAGDLTFE
jgi:enoyl-CoA hydratase